MKIFIGSSTEYRKVMNRITEMVGPRKFVRWDDPRTFVPEESIYQTLIQHSRTVDAAIFVFAEDDLVWSRKNISRATRDNVLLEYGLFVGALGAERVRRIVVGEPKVPTDLLGITFMKLSRGQESEFRNQLRRWLEGLPPIFFRDLAFDVAFRLAQGRRLPVRVILENRAPSFMNEKGVTQIRALCSNKGRFASRYYGKQFEWVKEKSGKRKLRRIFVAKRGRGEPCFSPGERKGILMHLNQNISQIEARWVFADDRWLGRSYGDSLGFALFDEKWIVHWGLRSGYCYIDRADIEVGKEIKAHFERMWKTALTFTEEMVKVLRSLGRDRNANGWGDIR